MTIQNKTEMREYHTWWRMKQNCKNKNYHGYSNYGAKGITYCKEWERFENFMADMGNMPDDCNSILLVDRSIEYCKFNCKWGVKERGRPRVNKEFKKRPRKTTKIKNPKTLCITLPQDHVKYLRYLALNESKAKDQILGINDMIRLAINKVYPLPSTIDIFGDSNA